VSFGFEFIVDVLYIYLYVVLCSHPAVGDHPTAVGLRNRPTFSYLSQTFSSSLSLSLSSSSSPFFFCLRMKKKNNRAKNLLPLWGPDDSFHLNPMLLEKIIKSPYFQKCCQDLTDWNTLVDEVYYQVKHLEPWALGTTKANICNMLHTTLYTLLFIGCGDENESFPSFCGFCLLLCATLTYDIVIMILH
jgi:hypothetical protein